MYSFKETSTCEYEVMVLSPLLCSHPDYRPESANEQHINCKPADEGTATKPQDLVKTEKENYKMLTKNKMYEADFFQGAKGPGILAFRSIIGKNKYAKKVVHYLIFVVEYIKYFRQCEN